MAKQKKAEGGAPAWVVTFADPGSEFVRHLAVLENGRIRLTMFGLEDTDFIEGEGPAFWPTDISFDF